MLIGWRLDKKKTQVCFALILIWIACFDARKTFTRGVDISDKENESVMHDLVSDLLYPISSLYHIPF